MSFEVDWTLLADSSVLAHSFIDKINTALANASRPSFLGPIHVTEFDFGTVGPDIEIKDVGDVWKSFIEDDEEADSQDGQLGRGRARTPEHHTGPDGPIASASGASSSLYAYGQYHPDESCSRSGRHEEQYEQARSSRRPSQDPRGGGGGGGHYPRAANGRRPSTQHHQHAEDDETGSVYSGILSPRLGLNRFGAGIGLGAGMGVNLAGGLGNGGGLATGYITPGLNPSVYSIPVSNARGASRKQQYKQYPHHLPYLQDPYSRTHDDMGETQHTPGMMTGQADTPPMDPPLEPPPPQPLPSIQLLLHFTHTPNIHLTVLTSLQINYPSQMFMSLPLKLTLTGLSLNADMVLAFNGARKRVHLSIIDDYDPSTPSMTNSLASSAVHSPETGNIPLTGTSFGMHQSEAQDGQQNPTTTTTTTTSRGFRPAGTPAPYHYQPYTPGPATGTTVPEPLKPIGQRLLPALQIESEIGHADVHVLRNVGKVEKFILDLVRKTLVDELVFPNYHTVAL
ncbi:Mitochondrial distribution and morphology protein 12 [Naganishia albida]|nr:Mitochondrial distribution and morphology protein 12 [Naganishia albida]